MQRNKELKIPDEILITIGGFVLGLLAFFVLFFHSSISLIEEVPVIILIALVVIVIIIFRLEANKFGLITISSVVFVTLSLIVPFFIDVPDSYFFGDWDELPKVILIFLCVLALSVLMDVLLFVGDIPRLKFERFTPIEIIVITIVGILDTSLLLLFNYIPVKWIGFFLIFLIIAMLNVLCKLVIDKFGTISLIMLIFATLSVELLESPTLVLEEFLDHVADLSDFHLIVCGLLVGLTTDETLNVCRLKNIMHIVRGREHEYINTSYIGLPNNIFRGAMYGIIASIMTVTLFTEIEPELWLLELTGAITLISVLGGMTGGIIYNNFNKSTVLSLIRPWYKQIWEWRIDDLYNSDEETTGTRWISCCKIGDVDNDGLNEILVGDGNFNFRCLKEGHEVWNKNVRNIPGKCDIGDIDNDGKNEVIVGSYDGYLRCFKGNNGQELWRVWIGRWVWCCAIGDVDNDGENEVIVGSFDKTLRCFKKNREMWRVEFDSWLGCCAIGDVDNDGNNEIVAGGKDGTLRWFKNGVEVWRAIFGDWVTGCAIGDVDNDGLNEVIAGSNDGTLRCYKKDREIWRIKFYAPVVCCDMGDIDGDKACEAVIGCGDNTLRVIKNGKEVWSVNFNDYVGSCVVGDANNDGFNEIIAGDWESYLRCFKGNYSRFRSQ